jgi:hypothetical protein
MSTRRLRRRHALITDFARILDAGHTLLEWKREGELPSVDWDEFRKRSR